MKLSLFEVYREYDHELPRISNQKFFSTDYLFR